MNEIIMHDPLFTGMSNMFRNLEAMMDFDFKKESRGLRRWIGRPHNLITKKDEKGNIQGYKLEVVYTPFAKDEVKVEILDHVLTVKCGSENKIKDEDMDYCGISHQSYEFSMPLADSIDEAGITAKAEDGILNIEFPVKKTVENEVKPLQIEVK